ncbi:MAG: putative Ig domain-containing protein, partial [Gammaproteobacteria bacterium]|nr:putative Ig domain-containing protein [Gammaproteobacteria bacterium]
MVIRLHKWTFRISLAFILGGVISASALVLPAFTGTPSISGTAVVGNTLSIIDTEATDADVGDIVTVSYQWFADEVPIIGAVNIDYTLTTLEAHASISAQVTANDNNDGSVAITTANVLVANSPPVISGIPLLTVDQDSSYSFTPVVSDLDGDTQSFSIVNQPAWADFDTATGTLSGSPTNADVGTTSGIIITSTDVELASDSLASFDLEVININDAPVINSVAITAASQDLAYSYSFFASDVDVADTLTYSTQTVLPTWLNFDDSTGVLSGTPSNADVGDHAVTLRVSDGTVNVDQSFTISVSNINDAPLINSVAITAATEDTAYSYTFSATDADLGDSLTYSATVLPAWLGFDDSTGVLSGTPLNADVGDHAVNLRVSDGTVNVDQSFTISVSNINDAPVISSASNTVATEDLAYSYTLTATDADTSDTLTYSAPLLPGWLTFEPDTGDLSGTPLNEHVGDHAVTLRVYDGTVNVEQSFIITVSNTNDVPVIDSVFIATAIQDLAYSYTFSASDVDALDTLIYSAFEIPTWLSFDDSTGVLSGTPVNADVGNHAVTLRVSDGAVIVEQSFTISVSNTNDAPVISSTAITTATEDIAYSYTFSAIDADLDALTYSAPVSPVWLVINPSTGELTGTPLNEHVGDHPVTLRVFDGTVNVEQSFTITVSNTNDAPVISGAPAITVEEDSFYTFTPVSSDVDVGDSDGLIFTIGNKPIWADFDSATGTLSGTPNNANVGTTNNILITVSDASLASATLPLFNLQVVNTNDAPTVTSSAVVLATEDSGYSYSFAAEDVDKDDTLIYSATSIPAWLGFNAVNGVLSGTPVNADVGAHAVTLSVSDGAVTVDQSFTITVSNTNDAPTISGSSVTFIDEDLAYSFTPVASDVDVGDVLTFSINNQPSWASFSTTTGTLSGTPTNADVGITNNIVITVTDAASATDSLPAFNLNVSNINDAPVISSVALTGVVQDTAYSYSVIASDEDVGDVLIYSAPTTPAWLNFDASTGVLSGTPSNADVGDHMVTLRVSDGTVNVDQSFTITVSNTNDAPVISSTEITTATEDTAYSYTLTATDADTSDTLTYSAPLLPDWLTFDPGTSVLSGTPLNTNVGEHAVTLRVFDGTVNVDQSFTITVSNTNDAPVISSVAITAATQDLAYSYSFSASDVDATDTLTYSVQTVLPTWLSFDDSTAVLSGTPLNADVGNHAVTLRVSDGTVNVDQSFTITVNNTNDAPVISSTSNNVATEDLAYSYTFSATDADLDALTYSAPLLPGWLDFDPGTGVLSGSPLNADVGDHTVTLRVTDGTVNVDQSFTITVSNTNDAPFIDSVAIISATQDQPYSYTFSASDVDVADTLTYSALAVLPTWLNFDASTGVLSGTPSNDDVGDHTVTLRVSDGSVNVDQGFSITVNNTNDAPVISSTAITTATEDAAYSYTFTATDADAGDTLIYTAPLLPGWLVFDSGTGILSGTPDNTHVGEHSITLRVFDGTVNVDQSFIVTVINSNDLPVITSTAILSATEEVAYSYLFSATDVDVSDVLTYSAPVSPTWLSIDATTGELSGIPANADVGSHAVTLRVNDGSVDIDQSFTITVSNTNDDPVISSVAPTSATEEVAYSYTFAASDEDVGDVLSYSVQTKPDWLSFNVSTGELTGTPSNADVGTYLVTLRVTDGVVNIDQSFLINVGNV